jgi:hypothetical protein
LSLPVGLTLAGLTASLARAAEASVGGLADPTADARPADYRALVDQAERLAGDQRAFGLGPDGQIEVVYGLPVQEARPVFFPVSRVRPLPDGYAPPDLTGQLGRPLRALLVRDFQELEAAANAAGAYPSIVSGFRSDQDQARVFEQAVQRQLYTESGLDQEEAAHRAARFVAPPGRSQHQLGTTADLSSWEIGYAVRASFAETKAGRWLFERAWEFGFIVPYTEAAEARTGYVPEPWHIRWVGRPLAARLWEDGYPFRTNPTADDVLLALELLLPGRA